MESMSDSAKVGLELVDRTSYKQVSRQLNSMSNNENMDNFTALYISIVSMFYFWFKLDACHLSG